MRKPYIIYAFRNDLTRIIFVYSEVEQEVKETEEREKKETREEE